jgi:hypothetical protein
MFDAPSCHLQREKQNSGTGTKYFGGLPTSSTTITAFSLNILAFFTESISFEKANRSIVIIQSLRVKKKLPLCPLCGTKE